MEKIRAAKKVAPDSGWGWVVTFGVSMVNVSANCASESLVQNCNNNNY